MNSMILHTWKPGFLPIHYRHTLLIYARTHKFDEKKIYCENHIGLNGIVELKERPVYSDGEDLCVGETDVVVSLAGGITLKISNARYVSISNLDEIDKFTTDTIPSSDCICCGQNLTINCRSSLCQWCFIDGCRVETRVCTSDRIIRR